ncbi:MAG: HAD hydrolase-like protein [Candidatus Nanoarchaeia archaeon]|nr:HAD hydrolase-like protein [Candidatus Nanoarchaeia archaeon]
MAIKAILFDLDHTLVDTKIEYKFKVLNDVCSYFKKSVTIDEANKFWICGNRTDFIINKGINPKEFWDYFHEIDKIGDRIKNTYAYSGAINLLKKLKEK